MKTALKTFPTEQTSKQFTSLRGRVSALVLMGVLWLLSTGAQAQSFAWARSVKGNYAKTRILVQSNGDYILAGEYKGNLWIGSYKSCGAGGTDVFVAYFDGATGEPRWVKRLAGPQDDHLGDISLADGHLYITGSFRSTITIDNFRNNDPNNLCTSFLSKSLQSVGGSDIFMARYYISTGSLHWVASEGGLGNDEGRGIKVVGPAKNGQLVLTGTFSKEASFYGKDAYDNITKTITVKGEAIYQDAFLAKYKLTEDAQKYPKLDLQWATRVGKGSGDDYGSGVDMDQAGNIYMTGAFTHNLIFYSPLSGLPSTYLISNPQLVGYYDMFIAKYNAAGIYQWANQAGGNSLDSGDGITVDPAGNAYVVGNHYSNSMVFYNNKFHPAVSVITLTNAGAMDGFLAKYSTSGLVTWVRSLAGSQNDELAGIVRDAGGNVFVTGYFTGNATAQGTGGNISLNASGANDRDMVWIKYSSNGDILRRMTGGGPVLNQGHSVGMDNNGNAYISGYTYGGASFGPYAINTTGIFAVRINTARIKLGFRSSAEETEEVGIKAYPVPATDGVTIEFVAKESEYTSVDVFDAQGIIKTNLFKGQTQAGLQYELPLNVSQYTSGIYLVKQSSSNGAHFTKITVVH